MFAACATMAAPAEYAYLINKIAFFQGIFFRNANITYNKGYGWSVTLVHYQTIWPEDVSGHGHILLNHFASK
jgi:hypothetical protein